MKMYSSHLKLKGSVLLYVVCTIIISCYLFIAQDLYGVLLNFLLFALFALTLEYLMHIKEIDAVTGIYKKTKLMKDLKKSKEKGEKFSLCLIDFNGLKRINDEYGHVVGDKLILAFSKTIKETFKNDKEIKLYRYTSGDEFCIVSYTEDSIKLSNFTKKIENISRLDVPIDMLDGNPFSLSLTVSYGFSKFDVSKTLEEVIDEADKNMYEYKKLFKRQFQN